MMTLVAVLAFHLSLAGGDVRNGGYEAMETSGKKHVSQDAYPDAVLSATDSVSGATLSVDPNGTSLTARGRDGKVLWTVDIVRKAGKPATGEAVIRLVQVTGPGKALVVVGKGQSIEVDIATGEIKVQGED